MEEYNFLMQAIGAVGFPIVAFGYVIVRLEKQMGEVKESLNKVAVALATCPAKGVE